MHVSDRLRVPRWQPESWRGPVGARRRSGTRPRGRLRDRVRLRAAHAAAKELGRATEIDPKSAEAWNDFTQVRLPCGKTRTPSWRLSLQ